MVALPKVTDAVARLKGVFLENPGSQMSLDDASRLSGLEPAACLMILEALEDARFLTRTRDGLFVRRFADSPLS